MKRTKRILLPEGAVALTKEEMRVVEGGTVDLATREVYLNKSTCQNVAAELLRSKAVTGMTALEIAQEIYAHAVVRYKFEAVKNVPGVNGIYESAANGIHIADGGDTAVRKAAYSLIWSMF